MNNNRLVAILILGILVAGQKATAIEAKSPAIVDKTWSEYITRCGDYELISFGDYYYEMKGATMTTSGIELSEANKLNGIEIAYKSRLNAKAYRSWFKTLSREWNLWFTEERPLRPTDNGFPIQFVIAKTNGKWDIDWYDVTGKRMSFPPVKASINCSTLPK